MAFPSRPAAPADERAPARQTRLLLALLSLSYFLSYFDRLLMIVVAELVKNEFALSDTQLSLLNGAAFVIVYGVFGIVAGWLVDRHSRKAILVTAVGLWSLVSMLTGFAQSFVQLAIARAGVGIGEAGILPVSMSALADAYPKAKRPLAFGIFFAGGMMGILASFVLGTWVAVNYGWRAAFFVSGPPGLILAALIAWLAREPRREVLPEAADRATASSFTLVLRDGVVMLLIVAGAIGSFGNIGMMQWLPIFFIRSHGLDPQSVALLFGPALASGMTVGVLAGGWLGNRAAKHSFTPLLKLSAAALVLLVAVYLFLLWTPSLTLALAATFVGTALSVVYLPAFTSAYQSLCSPRARGTAAGLSLVLNSVLGGATCTFIVGMLSDAWSASAGEHSLRYAISAGTSFCLLAAALLIIAIPLVGRRESAGGGSPSSTD